MAIFKVKETEKVMTAYIYLVEAETKEDAVEKYVNELAGSLPLEDSYVTDDNSEDIVVID